MGNGGKQTWKRVRGERVGRTFRPLSLTPPFRHFFSLTFLCVFPTIWRPVTGYVRPSLPDRFLWYIFNLNVEHFWRFVIDQRGNGFGSTNFSTPSRLRNCHSFSFLVFFLLFFLFQFLSYFSDVFFTSFLSLTHSPPNLHLLHTRGNGHFVLLQTIRFTIPRSWLTQKVRAAVWSERLCTDWRFSVMETLAVILNSG